MPKNLSDLTTFAQMLATRYNGRTGHGSVSLWSVWNEPNLQLFLTPQFAGKKIVGPANYAKLYKAAYAGIKSGNPLAKVAIGETSARGRDKPLAGVSASVAPGTFARLLSQVKGLKFDAWAHHPYPTAPNLPPTQKVRYPNVTLSTLPTVREGPEEVVPPHGADLDHRVRPRDEAARARMASATRSRPSYAKQALTIAKKDPNVQMFIWFVFRDSAGNPWQSGLDRPVGHAEAGVRGVRLGRAADRRHDAGRQGGRARARDDVRPVSGALFAARVDDRDDVLRLRLARQGDRGRAADGDRSRRTSRSRSRRRSRRRRVRRYTVVATLNEINGHSQSRTAYITVS